MAAHSPHHKRKLEDEDSGSDLDFVYPPKKKAPTDSPVFKSASSFFGNLLGKFVDYISPSPSKPAKQTPGRSKPKNNLYNKNHKSNNNLQFNLNKRQRIMSQQGITSPQKNSDNKSNTINDNNNNTKVSSPDNDDVVLIPLTVYDDLQPTNTETYNNNPSSSSSSIQPSNSNPYSFDQNYSHDSLSPSFQPTILSRNTDKYPTSSSTTSFLDEVERNIEIDKFADRLNGIVLEDAMNNHISSSSSHSVPRSLSHSLSRSLAPSQALSSIIPVPRTLSSSSLVNKEKRKPLDTSVNDVILLNESAADTSAAFVPVSQTRRVSTRDVQAKRVDESYQEYLVSPAKKSIDKFVTLTREASFNEKQSYNKMVEARLREMGNELGFGKEESLPVLTSEQQAQVTQAFGSHRDDSDEVLSEAFNVQIRREDIRCLKPGDWLNDEVINFYINLLMERNKSSTFTKTKSYIFNTHFYSLLYYNAKKYDYARVRRWTSKIGEDVFKLDKIIVPIHLGMHWCLAVINLKQKRFEYYDSLLSPNDECIGVLRRWLTDEAKKANHPLDLSQWTDHTPKDIPRQKNGFDCGVFMLRFAERASCDKRFDFSQDTMAAMRKIMVHEIITKKAFG